MTALSPITELIEPAPTLYQQDGEPITRIVAVVTAERGPIGVRTECHSEDHVMALFGGHNNSFTLHKNIHALFKEAKKYAKYVDIIRTVHYSDIADASTATAVKASGVVTATTAVATVASVVGSVAGPWSLLPGDTLVYSANRGADQTVTFDASPASLECVSTEPYALTTTWTLTLKIDNGIEQTITFVTGDFPAIGAATAEEVVDVINAQLVGGYAQATTSGTKFTIFSDTKGTDSGVQITGGLANGPFGFTTSLVSGIGDVADIYNVTPAEAIALIEADTSDIVVTQASGFLTSSTITTGTSAHIQVQTSSSAEVKFGFATAEYEGTDTGTTTVITVNGKTEGTYGNNISIVISDPTSGEVAEFKLQVKVGSTIKETYDDLSMTSTDDNYFVTIVNNVGLGVGSNLVALVDPSVGTRPTNGTYGALTGGDDGLSGLTDTDFTGNKLARTGVYAAQDIQTPFILLSPEKNTAAIQTAFLDFCEVEMDLRGYYLPDVPVGYTYSQAVTWVKTTASLLNYSECGEIAFGEPKIVNPDKVIYGNTDSIQVSMACIIAGKMARGDNENPGGIYKAIAGPVDGILTSIVGMVDTSANDRTIRDILYPARINPVWFENGKYILDGSRTLKAGGNWPTRNQKRSVQWHEYYLKQIEDKYRGSTIPVSIKAPACERQMFAYLSSQIQFDAYSSRKPSEAFIIDVVSKNTASTELAGEFSVKVGISTVTPGEFNKLYVSKDTRRIDAELAELNQ